MSLFPFMDAEDVDVIDDKIPMAKEYAWDFNKLEFKKKNGKMYLVEGNEAIKVWIWKIFNTTRYRYIIFSWYYGHELESLVGKGTNAYMVAEAERMCKEAILSTLGNYIKDLKNFDIELDGRKLDISFTAVTIYGEVDIFA